MSALVMRLEGPLQAWGVDGAQLIRRTHLHPQKRAVLGLIRAAKGLSRDETWDALDDLSFQVRVLKRPRRMWDFAGVRNTISADGKFLHKQRVLNREYLADAAFLVALEGESDLLEEVRSALRCPVFLLGLGRRDCPASYPIFFSLSDDSSEVALEKAEEWIRVSKTQISI